MRSMKGESFGYGPDPNLITPSVHWSRTLSPDQRDSLASLSDILLPPIGQMTKPTEIGIVDFLDEWLSAPYDPQRQDRELALHGLSTLDEDSRTKFGYKFTELTTDQKIDILDAFANASTENDAVRRPFFQRIRSLVIGGYYTTDMGLRAIGYRGNIPLEKYRGLSAEIYSAINAELVRIGLPPQSEWKE